MDLIDDDGRLFGLVNIIDALVVLLVFAIIVAGVAVILQPEATRPEATEFATLDLGMVPTYIGSAINEGDSYEPSDGSNLTITDVYLTPQGDDIRAFVRVRLRGQRSSGAIRYDGAPPRLGRSLNIVTNRYEVSGQIRQVGDASSIARDFVQVVLRTRVPTVDARELAPGDEVRVAGRTVARVADVAVYPTEPPTKALVFMAVNLSAQQRDGVYRFGGTPLARGQDIRLATADYDVRGRIQQVGTGLHTATQDVLITTTVDSVTADRIAAGDTVAVAGYEAATVESVTVYGTNNPERKRVFVGLSLDTAAVGTRQFFGAVPVQRGNPLTIETAGYTLTGDIDRVGALSPRGSATTRTVRLRLSEVRDSFADAIQPGLRERATGETIARITGVEVEPSVVLVKGTEQGDLGIYDHPYLREVTITADLRVRQTTDGVRFKGRPLRQGETVTLDLGTLVIRATVISIR